MHPCTYEHMEVVLTYQGTGWLTCPNGNWPIQSRASVWARQVPLRGRLRLAVSAYPENTRRPSILILLILLHHHHLQCHCRYHYRSSACRYYLLHAAVPLPAWCRLHGLAPQSLDCCPMQLLLSAATIPAGSERPSTRHYHYCGVHLWWDREMCTCRSLMDSIHGSLLFVFPVRSSWVGFLRRLDIYQSILLACLSFRNWLRTKVTLVHAGAQRWFPTAHPKGHSAQRPQLPSTPSLSTLMHGCRMIARGGGQQNCNLSGPYMAGSHRWLRAPRQLNLSLGLVVPWDIHACWCSTQRDSKGRRRTADCLFIGTTVNVLAFATSFGPLSVSSEVNPPPGRISRSRTHHLNLVRGLGNQHFPLYNVILIIKVPLLFPN